MTSDASPRSTNSQVRLEVADGELEPRELGLVAAEGRRVDSGGVGPRLAQLGSAAPASAAIAAPSEDAVEARSALPPSRARRLARAPRGPGRGPPSGPARRCRPGDSGRGSRGACCREAQGVGGLGVELVVAARRRLAPGCIHRAECIGHRHHGESLADAAVRAVDAVTPGATATPAHEIRNTRMPSMASASAGSAGIGSRTSSKHGGVRVRPVEDRGPLVRARPWRR